MDNDLNFNSAQGSITGPDFRNRQIDERGCIQVKNISAYWLPKLTITEIIAGTTYTVTGSYEGTGSFLQKLERIMAKNFTPKPEDTE